MKKKIFNVMLVCNMALSPFLAPLGIYAEELNQQTDSSIYHKPDAASEESAENILDAETENMLETETEKVKIDAQYFPDENVRAAVSIFDLDQDGYLSTEEIQKVTELDFSNKQIQDIKGLEIFSAVKKASFANNHLAEIRPEIFPLLEELDVRGNQLQKIDLEKNLNLVYFAGEEQKVSKQGFIEDGYYKVLPDYGDFQTSIEIISSEWQFDTSGNLMTQSPVNDKLNYIQHVQLKGRTDETYGQLQVTIEPEFPTSTFQSFALELPVGDVKDLMTEFNLFDLIASDLRWESSDDAVARVDQDGVVEGVIAGETTIRGYDQLNLVMVDVKLVVVKAQSEQTAPAISYSAFWNGNWSGPVKDGETLGDLTSPIQGLALELSGEWQQNSQVVMDVLLSGQDKWQTKEGDLQTETSWEAPIDGIKLTLSGKAAEDYSIFYRVKLKNYEWLAWTSDGQPAGSQGINEAIVGIEIKIQPKATAKLLRAEQAFMTKDTLPLPILTYDAHSQSVNWRNGFKANEVAGTTGKNLRLEAIRMFLENKTGKKGTIQYSTHVQTLGWKQGFVSSGISGTVGQSLRVEAMRIQLTDELKEYFDIYYRVHSAKYGWLGWAKNGKEAGTSGLALPAEAFQVVIKRVGEEPPKGGENAPHISVENMLLPSISYQVHQRSIGWGQMSKDGVIAGTTGKSLRGEAIKISLGKTNVPGGIEYKSHVQKKGWMPSVANNNISGTTGQALRMEAFQLKLTGELGKYYDVYYRAHIQSYGWLDWARNGQNAGSVGLAKQVEAIQIMIKKKGEAAPGNTTKPFVEMEEFLFVMGHGGVDPGASYNGVNERDFTRGELLPYLRKYAAKLKNKKINFYDTNANMYADSVKGRGAYTISNGLKSVIEIHLDAGVANISTGGHVIVHKQGKTATNLALAGTINKYVGLSGAYKGNGGLSYREDLLNLRVLKSRNIDYRLTELGFITNNRDVANIRRNIDGIAKNLVENVTGEKL